MSSSPDDILVIKNGTLIDGTGGRSRPNRRIVRISRTALSGKTSRLRPRHVVSKPGQTHELEGLVEVREWIAAALASSGLVVQQAGDAFVHEL